jgi:hypothetical protein
MQARPDDLPSRGDTVPQTQLTPEGLQKRERYAPLILIPVELVRKGARERLQDLFMNVGRCSTQGFLRDWAQIGGLMP